MSSWAGDDARSLLAKGEAVRRELPSQCRWDDGYFCTRSRFEFGQSIVSLRGVVGSSLLGRIERHLISVGGCYRKRAGVMKPGGGSMLIRGQRRGHDRSFRTTFGSDGQDDRREAGRRARRSMMAGARKSRSCLSRRAGRAGRQDRGWPRWRAAGTWRGQGQGAWAVGGAPQRQRTGCGDEGVRPSPDGPDRPAGRRTGADSAEKGAKRRTLQAPRRAAARRGRCARARTRHDAKLRYGVLTMVRSVSRGPLPRRPTGRPASSAGGVIICQSVQHSRQGPEEGKAGRPWPAEAMRPPQG
jgi:hypothetical protein